MNNLQLTLLGVGGALVAAVWGHGKWQERRQRKAAERLLHPESGDPLMEKRPTKVARGAASPPPERLEPVFDAVPKAPVSHEDDVELIDLPPRNADGKAYSASPLVHRTPSPTGPRPSTIGDPATVLVSPEADFIARFELPEMVSGGRLLGIPRDAFSLLRKRVVWVGYDESQARWEHVQPEGHYRELRIGLQLADRSGPINGALVEQFRKAVEHVGDELTAVPEIPLARDAVARAINLDRLCAEVDIQLAVHLAPRHEPFSPDQVRDTALNKGFRLASDGVLGYHNAAGDRLFSLQMPDARAPDGLPAPTACCILEVPTVDQGELAFDRMMLVAQELADVLEALLVDEHRRPITERFVAPVRQQIGQLQARMAQQGVAAGSPLALRLFA